SFVNYWVERNGEAALRLLFADLKAIGDGDANAALKSVSGYTLSEWNLMWKKHLLDKAPKAPSATEHGADEAPRGEARARWVRLSDLLHARGHFGAASAAIEPAWKAERELALIRWRAARSALADQRPRTAREALGAVSDLDIVHGAWFALRGRFLEEDGASPEQARQAYDLGLAVDPLFDEVACHGRARREAFSARSPEHDALCRAARAIER